MRLFFEDPSGERLALDTNAHEWAATYETSDTKISDDHFIIDVESAEVLRRIEREADFCGYGYNKEIDDERRTPQTSVYADYLQELTSFYIQCETAGEYEGGPSVEDLKSRAAEYERRYIKAKKTGYFNARQANALLIILDDAKECISLYERTETAYNDAIEEQAPF